MEFGALKALAYSGGGWVIWLLIMLSVLTVAVIVERFLVQRREQKALVDLKAAVLPSLKAGDWEAASRAVEKIPGAAAEILRTGLGKARSGWAAAAEFSSAARLLERHRLEKHLTILGTLGNNGPFIGLFGTVLGIIKAFHDLAVTASTGPEAVMQGLSEALVATAVGLLVAIPAVMAYNYFQKRLNDVLGEADALVSLLMGALKDDARGAR